MANSKENAFFCPKMMRRRGENYAWKNKMSGMLNTNEILQRGIVDLKEMAKALS